MKLVKKVLVISMIIISILIFISAPSFATQTTDETQEKQTGLTKEQQAYLQKYVLTYVVAGSKKNIFEYSIRHDIVKSYDNEMSSNRKDTVLLCIVLCHNATPSIRCQPNRI